jgi:hypothetical protein
MADLYKFCLDNNIISLNTSSSSNCLNTSNILDELSTDPFFIAILKYSSLNQIRDLALDQFYYQILNSIGDNTQYLSNVSLVKYLLNVINDHLQSDLPRDELKHEIDLILKIYNNKYIKIDSKFISPLLAFYYKKS